MKRLFRTCPHCGSILPPKPKKSDEPDRELTDRQMAVLKLVAKGGTAASIADELGLSRRTVEFHRAMVMERLRLRTIAELTLYAATRKLI